MADLHSHAAAGRTSSQVNNGYSYSAWLKAGLTFGGATLSYAALKTVGTWDWLSSQFMPSASSTVGNSSVALHDKSDRVAITQRGASGSYAGSTIAAAVTAFPTAGDDAGMFAAIAASTMQSTVQFAELQLPEFSDNINFAAYDRPTIAAKHNAAAQAIVNRALTQQHTSSMHSIEKPAEPSFDSTMLALGALGTFATGNPLPMALGLFGYGGGAYAQSLIPNQIVPVGSNFSLSINTTQLFGGPVSGVTVLQQNGAALPGWLHTSINATLLGSYPANASSVTRIAVSGNIAYVTNAHYVLQLVNFNNPAVPVQLGTYASISAGLTEDVVVSGNIAYVLSGQYRLGVQIVDVSISALPRLIASYNSTFGYGFSDMALYGNQLYLLGDGVHLEIVSVQNYLLPTFLGTYYYNVAAPSAAGIVVKGGNSIGAGGVTSYHTYAYILITATSIPGLIIVNVDNSASPFFVGNYTTPGYPSGIALSADSTLAYVSEHGFGSPTMLVLNVQNPAVPVLVGRYVNPTNAYPSPSAIALIGNIAYVASSVVNFVGITMLDVTNSSNPLLAGKYNTADAALTLATRGNILLVGEGDRTELLDIGTRKLSGVPQLGDVGMDNITVTAVNSLGVTVKYSFSINVVNPVVSAAPTLSPTSAPVVAPLPTSAPAPGFTTAPAPAPTSSGANASATFAPTAGSITANNTNTSNTTAATTLAPAVAPALAPSVAPAAELQPTSAPLAAPAASSSSIPTAVIAGSGVALAAVAIGGGLFIAYKCKRQRQQAAELVSSSKSSVALTSATAMDDVSVANGGEGEPGFARNTFAA